MKSPGLLRDPGTALASVAVSSIWASLGFTFLLVTAGLQGIPRDLHEAAAVDGAGGVRRFWSITLPMLGPTLLFVLVVLTTRAFQAYGEIDLLTRGGPRPEASTTTLTYLTYGTDSIINNNLGLQSAVAVLLFLVLLVLAAIQLWPSAATGCTTREGRRARRATVDGHRTTRRERAGGPSGATGCSSSCPCSCCSRSTRPSSPP